MTDSGQSLADYPASSTQPSLHPSKNHEGDTNGHYVADMPGHLTGALATIDSDRSAPQQTLVSVPVDESFDASVPDRAPFSSRYTVDDPFDASVPEDALFSSRYAINDPYNRTYPQFIPSTVQYSDESLRGSIVAQTTFPASCLIPRKEPSNPTSAPHLLADSSLGDGSRSPSTVAIASYEQGGNFSI